jgi:hypothetical protein
MNQKYTSEVIEELKKLAPVLSGLPKDNLLKLPEGYFEDVEDKILSQIHLTNYDLKPSVPPGYLEKVEDVILRKVKFGPSDKKHQVISMLKYRKIIASIAAVMLFILTAWFVFNREERSSGNIAISIEDHDAYLEYIHKNIGDYDINMLVDQGLIEEDDLVMDTPVIDQLDSEDESWIESEINF